MTYSEKLQDPRWQKKRLEILSRDGWACRDCGSTEKTLHVHHKFYYFKKVEPWEYMNDDLVALCWECHSEIEDQFRSIRLALGDMKCAELRQVVCALLECSAIGMPGAFIAKYIEQAHADWRPE